VYSAKAEEVIRSRAPLKKPFYLSVAPLAPHGESANACACAGNTPRAAPRHEGDLGSEALPLPPNFNELDVSDKPADIQALTVMGNSAINAARNRYRARLEAVLAVDEMVQNLVDTLKDVGELSDTVIIFTADNGFFHGEHRVRTGKVRLYEESIRVPMIIRGPGIPVGVTRTQLSSNIDLAPTILDIADAEADRKVDGRSLLPLAADRLLNPGRAIVLETFFNADDPNEDPENPPTRYRAVRTDRYVYAEHGTGEQELYDLELDPFELQSRHADPALGALRSRLATLLHRLQECDAKVCRSMPALALRLRFRRGPGRCVEGPVRARVVGKQRVEGVSARFFAGSRKAGRDFTRPLRGRIGRGRLRGGGVNRIRAIVTVLDGRQRTLSRTIPRRC
jgi:arylsulfatase A-like enzyme